MTQEDLTQGYIDATLSHVGADGSSHDITSQLTLSDGSQSVVSDAYTVTINEAVPENQAPVVPETVSLLATEDTALTITEAQLLGASDVDGDSLPWRIFGFEKVLSMMVL